MKFLTRVLAARITQLAFLAAALSACATVNQHPSQQVDLSTFEGRDTTAILFMKGDEKLAAFRNGVALSPTRLVEASAAPYPLPKAGKELPAIEFKFDGKSHTLESVSTLQNVTGLVAIKNGEVLHEQYALGNTEESRWISFSIAKSVVSLLIGAAIKDGYIEGPDEKIVSYMPQLAGSAYEDATIQDLLQMASGAQWNEDYADPNSDVARADYSTLGLYKHLGEKESLASPGEAFNYNTAETNLAGTLLRSAIGNNLSTYLQQKIWQPFGMESDAYWQLTEEGGGEFGGCCINATLRDYARIGLFAMAEGKLPSGEKMLPDNWMTLSTAPSSAFDGYGYFWWLNPNGSYQARGIFGQAIYINPANNTVIAIHAAREHASKDEDKALQYALLVAMDEAMK